MADAVAPAPPSAAPPCAAPPCQVHLIRPEEGAAIAPGGRISGIGWVAAAGGVAAIAVDLGAVRLGPARLVRSATDFAMLGGDTLPDGATGFVFAATVPAQPLRDGVLRLQIDTAAGRHEHAVSLRPPDPLPVPAAPQPILAVIETARIDERGLLRVAGWAASLPILEELRVFVGERAAGLAQRGLRRDDVAASHPGYPNAMDAGFLLLREATDADLGQQAVHVVASAAGGVRRAFSAPLARAGRQRPPPPPETLARLTCEEVSLSDHGRFAVKGWAICAAGITDIRVVLGDVEVGVVMPAEERPDVANRYPRIPGAAQAGFRLACDLAARFEGEHVVRLLLRGRDGAQTTILQPVTASETPAADLPRPSPATPSSGIPPSANPAGEALRCFLDAPALRDGHAIETVRGFMALTGWAFGPDRIDRIEVFVDGRSQGRAHHGIRREDLRSAFPGHDALLGGFAMVIPPQVMRPGPHEVRVAIRDTAGRTREIDFAVRAAKAASGPGPWMLRTRLPQAEIGLQHAILAATGLAPGWTILLAAAGPSRALAATIESLRRQAYADWRLVILADTRTAARHVTAHLAAAGMLPDGETASPDGRFLIRLARPGRAIAATLGAADFLVPLAPGDVLGEDALLELSLARALDPRADFLYSDERRIDPSDGEDKAFFKPDFSPDLLLSTNYIGRLWAAAPALLRAAGLTEGEWRGLGDYDAVLRLTERAGRIRHLPKVLCAAAAPERKPQESQSLDHGALDHGALDHGALARAMHRRGIAGTLLPGPVRGTHRLRRPIAAPGRVSIVIPTNAARDLVRTAIASIRAHTAWPDYEIVVLDNIPRPGTPAQEACRAWIGEHADRVVAMPGAFNWSRFNNRGAAQATGAYLLFLNDDIEIRDPGWLHGLVEHAQRPEIGVVGPQLLYPDGRVQHAGVFLARHAARHAFRFYPRDAPGPFGLALTQRDVVGVTGACMMMRREIFDQLGGFDEAHPVVNNDLDFNLRARNAGKSIVYTPAVSLIHHEMISRASLPDSHDAARFDRDWGDLFLAGDPFFSPHLSRDCDDYQPEAEPTRAFTTGHPLLARGRIRRILVLKLDHIGDFVTAFPVLRRLRQLFPAAELTILAASASLALAPLEPAIDRMIAFDFFHARSEKGRKPLAKRQLADLHARLAPENFDLAIDLRRQPDTRPVLRAVPATWRAGFDTPDHPAWLDIAIPFEGDIALHPKRAHVTDALALLVDAIAAQCDTDRQGVAISGGRPAVPPHAPTPAPTPVPPATPTGDRAAARRALARLVDALPPAKPRSAPGKTPARSTLGAPLPAPPAPDYAFVCVHTGAGARNKQWPPASFAGLIDLLAADPTIAILVVGGPDETGFVRRLLRRVRRRHAVTDLTGRIPLADLPALLRGADLYVGNDSGPKHIAAALGVPTIGIHGGTVDPAEWGAMGPNALTIARAMTCSPCYLARAEDCHRGLACLDGIRVGDVYAACLRLLALAPPRDPAPPPSVPVPSVSPPAVLVPSVPPPSVMAGESRPSTTSQRPATSHAHTATAPSSPAPAGHPRRRPTTP